MSGYYKLLSGRVLYEGEALTRERLSLIGVLIENPGVYRKLSVYEYLTFFGKLYAVNGLPQRINELLNIFSLEDKDFPTGKLSLGDRQKLHLIRSIIHQPQFVLWDEPFSHLDPLSQEVAIDFLKAYVEEHNSTVVVATHQLEQAESFVTQFGIMEKGRLLYTHSGEDNTEDRVQIVFAGSVSEDDLQWITELSNVTLSVPSGSSEALLQGVRLHQKIPSILKVLCEKDFSIRAVIPSKGSLRELYHKLIGHHGGK